MLSLGQQLWTASREGKQGEVEKLLNEGAEVDFAQSENGAEPIGALAVAAKFGHLEVVKLLLGRGANVHLFIGTGSSALMVAALAGHRHIVAYLVEECRANIDDVNGHGSTALHIAALDGCLEMVKMLASHGADLRRRTGNNQDGITAFMMAVYNSHLDVIKFLLKRGVGAGEGTLHGINACSYAAYEDNIQLCVLLVKSGGMDPAQQDASSGKSALTHYGQWLDEENQVRIASEEKRPSLSEEQKQARVKLLKDARAEYLELQRREECYQRRKNAITFLQGSGFLLTAAQREARKAEEAQVDTHAKLAAIDRSTKEANLKYLMDRVFREDKGMHLGREIVMML